jgi:predicted nucleotidyltransferase
MPSPFCARTSRSFAIAECCTLPCLARSRATRPGRQSDIDILVEIEPDAPVGVFEYVGIIQYLADLFPGRVDVANRSSLKPFVRPSAERDAVYAF